MEAQTLLQEAQALRETLVSHRRYLHTHPGTGFEIEDTVAYVKQELARMGYEPEDCG